MDLNEKRILVTGGAGFIGSHVVDRLSERDCKSIFIPRSQEYDLRDAGSTQRIFKEFKPHLVIHLAGNVGGIGASELYPADLFYDNAIIGINLLEHSRRAGVEKFVGIGNVCSYPKLCNIPFSEDDLWSGYPEEVNAPNGLAKRMLLAMGQAYRKQYGLNSIHLIPVNVYGPGDNFNPLTSHVIPAIIRKAVEAKESGAPEIALWGDGSPTREFIFVEDVAEAIVLATERYDGAEPVNLGTGQEISIRELAELICRKVGFDGDITWQTSKPGGQPRRCMDVRRAKKLFGFKARFDLDEGIASTVEWFLADRINA